MDVTLGAFVLCASAVFAPLVLPPESLVARELLVVGACFLGVVCVGFTKVRVAAWALALGLALQTVQLITQEEAQRHVQVTQAPTWATASPTPNRTVADHT